MNNVLRVTAAGAAALFSGWLPLQPQAASAADTSAAIPVLGENDENAIFWRTANGLGTQALDLRWPADAASAKLSYEGEGLPAAVTITDTTLPSYPLAIPASLAEERECLLKLQFLNANNTVITTETARVAFVAGATNAPISSVTRCLPSTAEANERLWHKIPAKYVVLPVAQGVETLTFDGTAVRPALGGLAGWYEWGPIEYGDHTAAMDAGTAVTLTRYAGGTIYRLN